jgi:hypothetical protein
MVNSLIFNTFVRPTFVPFRGWRHHSINNTSHGWRERTGGVFLWGPRPRRRVSYSPPRWQIAFCTLTLWLFVGHVSAERRGPPFELETTPVVFHFTFTLQ